MLAFARLHEELGGVPANRLQVGLKLLKDGGLIEQDENLDYRLADGDINPAKLAQLLGSYRDKNARDHAALEHMVFYAQTGFCRWKVMLEYFGEHVEWSHCGVCDNCRQPPEQTLSPVHRSDGETGGHETHGDKPILHVGDGVRLARFGEGRVASVAGDKVSVAFPDGSSRTFLRDYVKLI